MLLTHEEIDDLSREMVKGNKSVNWLCGKVISAYEAKLREQKPVALPFAILDEEMKDLRRFHECVSDGEGYDVPKERMKRLSEIGLLRRVTTNFYEHTTFGISVINGDFTNPAPIPEVAHLSDIYEQMVDKPAPIPEGWQQFSHTLKYLIGNWREGKGMFPQESDRYDESIAAAHTLLKEADWQQGRYFPVLAATRSE